MQQKRSPTESGYRLASLILYTNSWMDMNSLVFKKPTNSATVSPLVEYSASYELVVLFTLLIHKVGP